PYLLFEGESLTFAAVFREACRYANLFLAHRRSGRPFHVGLLLENRPEFVCAELGAGLAGATVVGLNPTRRGEPLARDVAFSDCQLVVTEPKFEGILADALDAPGAVPPTLARIWSTSRRNQGASASGRFASLEDDLASGHGPSDDDPGTAIDEDG